ncbi:MAG: phosphoribosylglycinamide formyltransferase [Marine Group III euryarchaeote CG-Bathy2]|uniref:phosphoribosylglycinamide formyltransferase 1 n=4 Tax=Methanobacteriati TaxID=3366610 RepID=A0A075HTI0_9EURY|nr:phosphoribosylglycinamide formyltransferase (purN) [uncultured marine group II/III euryarchaeote KM3_141_A08]AIF17742.1 phosphoribosylglycinamide formyltransferase (purN) [uncultured marine group II/III euryarchaeote KM3_79_B02]AIF20371.1 phosphoribosylglycinamide formyltransferase (purN) [uncultured marine group II/III euryarchaeote KM3_89_F04]OIR10250.1 MAG: phosphoribosylglycinamide formyltransferase [Marine Group III euryarchaeote CG-Bathy2]
MRFAVMASGRGSNFQALIDARARGELPGAELVLLIVNRRDAQAIARAEAAGIPWEFIDSEAMARAEFDRRALALLRDCRAEAVVLAGFMRLLTPEFIEAFRHRILNIHPALLPLFPGAHAHRDALAAGVAESGCSAHFVDDGIDTGPVILQRAVPVLPGDTEETLAARILPHEHRLLPEAVRLLAAERLEVDGNAVRILPEK